MAQGAAVTVACAATRQILFKNPQVYITGLKQNCLGKVEKILKGNLDSISSPSPSVKIHIMDRKVCLRHKGKTLLVKVEKL